MHLKLHLFIQVIAFFFVVSCGTEEAIEKSGPSEDGPHGSDSTELTDSAEGIELDSDKRSKKSVRKNSSKIKSADNIKIVVEIIESKKIVRFKNESKDDVWFRGFGIASPMYDLQTRDTVDDEWESGLGWCGNGLMTLNLAPGKSLDVQYTDQAESAFTRIGLRFGSSDDFEYENYVYSVNIY